MEDLLKYENRENLYGSLLKELDLKKVDEKYDAEAFGNFYIILAAKEFQIRYVNDRDFLTIEFASNYVPPNKYGFTEWLDLSFLMNLVNNAPEINPDNTRDNFTRIRELNDFLKNEYDLINDLLDKDNYKFTLDKLDALLEEEFRRRYPNAIKD